MSLLKRTARPFVVLVERYYPDPFVFVIALTGITLVAAIMLTGSSASLALTSWGDGLPLLLAFMAQIAVTLITAHALAHTDAVGRLLAWLGARPRRLRRMRVGTIRPMLATTPSLVLYWRQELRGGVSRYQLQICPN